MKKQPDDLFREKLGGLQMQPPRTAWTRVEDNLSKKNNKVIWLRYAAAAVLVAGGFALWLSSQPASTNNQLSDAAAVMKQTDTRKDSVKSAPASAGQQTTVQPKEEKKKNDNSTVKSPAKTKKKEQRVERNSAMFEKPLAAIGQPEAQVADGEEVTLPTGEAIASVETIEAQKKLSSTVIVYNAQEINEKYLDKKLLGEATPGEEKGSTLQKLLDKAYDLKHSQDPLGQLRHRKNEILALNFRKEKQRNQNSQ
jgi:hypothetical protein